jgi:hypothetical protein
MVSTIHILERMLDPVGLALGPDAARKLIALRADADAQRRMDELAEKANEGSLTSAERSEYETLIAAATVIAALQAKARAHLAGSSAA